MSRLFVIGDVHGMSETLAQLIPLLDTKPGDRFAFLGDYVDKGPNSLIALRFVRTLVEQYPGSVAIAGNHEDSAMRLYAKAQKQGNWDGLRKVDKEPWLKSMTEADYQWLRSLPLIARPLPGVVMVHGGMFPAFFEKHGEVGEVSTDWHKGGGKRMDRMRRFLRVRHVYKPGSFSKKGKPVDGQMVSLGDGGVDPQLGRLVRWSGGLRLLRTRPAEERKAGPSLARDGSRHRGRVWWSTDGRSCGHRASAGGRDQLSDRGRRRRDPGPTRIGGGQRETRRVARSLRGGVIRLPGPSS